MESPTFLLDDDPLMHAYWALSAKAAAIPFRSFGEPQAFLNALASAPKSTRLFIDAKLAQGQRGEDIAGQAHSLGFTQIYLCTGLPPDAIAPCPWILAVVGKSPPWEK